MRYELMIALILLVGCGTKSPAQTQPPSDDASSEHSVERVINGDPHETPNSGYVKQPIQKVNCTLDTTNVLILGDSISMDYTAETQKRLMPEMQIDRARGDEGIPEKVGGSWVVKYYAAKYVTQCPKWDLIIYNAGIWDMSHPVDGSQKPTTSLNDYGSYLRWINAYLKTKATHVAFVTTTPIEKGDKNSEWAYLYQQNYDDLAVQIANDDGIAIIDLGAWAKQRMELKNKGDVHWRKPGAFEYFGAFIAQEIQAILSN